MANNQENLKPVRSKEEARERGKNGGIKSGEARRAKKTMKEMLDYLLEKEIANQKTGEIVTYREAILTSCINKAIKGDVKAAQFVRDTAGEAPINKTEVTGKDGAPLVQKVFVTENEKREIDNKIDDIINGK